MFCVPQLGRITGPPTVRLNAYLLSYMVSIRFLFSAATVVCTLLFPYHLLSNHLPCPLHLHYHHHVIYTYFLLLLTHTCLHPSPRVITTHTHTHAHKYPLSPFPLPPPLPINILPSTPFALEHNYLTHTKIIYSLAPSTYIHTNTLRQTPASLSTLSSTSPSTTTENTPTHPLSP